MMREGRDLVICDFAEFYHIYDMEGLPLRYVATLASGLGGNSRIISKINGIDTPPPEHLLLTQLIDSVNTLTWAVAGKKDQPPASLMEKLYLHKEESGFDTAKEFEEARRKIIAEVKRHEQ